jgi:hypothetical protein
MSSSSRSLSAVRPISGLPVGRMSHAKAFAPLGGRGRAEPHRPARLAPIEADRAGLLVWWSGLLMRRCGSVRGVVRVFECTEQTARNWFDGFSCPTGVALDLALRLWPADFAARAADARGAA